MQSYSTIMNSDNLKLMVFVIGTGLLAAIVLVVAQKNLYTAADGVVELTTENFKGEVLQDDGIWVVQFYALWCSNCHALHPEYTRLAKALKGVIKVGVVNAERELELGRTYNIRGYPMIKVFGTDKKRPINYFGPRTAKSIGQLAIEEIKRKLDMVEDEQEKLAGISFESGVHELQAETFDKEILNSARSWLVLFYLPECPHCQQLAPEWSKMAENFKDSFKLAALDASVYNDKALENSVHKYPTIKYFRSKSKRIGDALEYDGNCTAFDILNWANQRDEEQLDEIEVMQLTDDSVLYSACKDTAWCMIAVLPTLADCNAKCRNNLLDTLRKSNLQFRDQNWGWGWTEAGQQPEVEKGLKIVTYPALAAVNCGKKLYTLFESPITEAGLNEFFTDITEGRDKSVYINCPKRPHIQPVTPWSGQDAEPAKEAVCTRTIDDEL